MASANSVALVQQAASDLIGIIHDKRDVLPMDVHADLCLVASYLDEFLKSITDAQGYEIYGPDDRLPTAPPSLTRMCGRYLTTSGVLGWPR